MGWFFFLMVNNSSKISTGSYDLNTWLYGGYEKDVITMLAGPPGSGKTNLALLVACSQAKKGNKVIFVDTEGGFSVERVKQIVGSENSENVLKNIFLLGPTCFKEQKDCMDNLVKTLKKEHVSLVVVDGMAMLYRLELGDAVKSGDEKVQALNREVAYQMRALAEIARKQKIPVVITNQVYGNFLTAEEIEKGIKKEMNIVGGDLFKYWSKCIIELQRDGSRRKLVLLKHRSLPTKTMGFIIKDEGIFKRGWI
jgi:DNA repair protein RadB